MGSPHIKLYILPNSYTEESDSDVRRKESDELLPVVDKPTRLEDALPLTGIVPHEAEALQPLDLVTGEVTEDLVASTNGYSPEVTDIGDIVQVTEGPYRIRVQDDNGDLESDEWSLVEGEIVITEDASVVGDLVVRFFKKAATPAVAWALASNALYVGDNDTWNKLWVQVDDGVKQIIEPESNDAHVLISGGASEVLATYAHTSSLTRYWIGEHDNWVVDHLWMRPDVFAGRTDYPGDVYEDEGGTPFEPGVQPQFMAPSTYGLRARDGMVVFHEPVDAVQLQADDPEHDPVQVRANYAYLWGIRNVSGQQIEPVPGSDYRRFKAINDTAYSDSFGRPWVGRKSATLPRNVYVNGQITPTVHTVTPYDQLVVKTS